MISKGIVEKFLRWALALGFLSAVADRMGLWHYHVAWGNWGNFLDYTQTLLPWLPEFAIAPFGFLATALELGFGIVLLIGWKVRLFAQLSGWLLLAFALAMTFSTGIKTAFDASVFTAAAGAFALAHLNN